MNPLAAAFSLVVGAAGWYYLFYSRAAENLAGVEQQAINRRRVRLRRLGGVAMLLLAVGFYAGVVTVDSERSPAAFLAIWLGVLLLLGLIVLLGLIDLRLTLKLRRQRRGEEP